MPNRTIHKLADIRSAREFDHAVFTPKPRAKLETAYKRHPYTPNNWRASHEDSPWIARLFVGFSVGDVPTYNMMSLVKLVKRVRKAQTGKADSSFVYQKGIYTHHAGAEVIEDAAQVLLLNDPGSKVTKQQFIDQMLELAEVIREEMQQETVIVEIQKGGIVYETWGVDGDG